jgi:sulfatase-like protein
MSRWRPWVLHPMLIAGAFILDVALANDIEPVGFIRPLLIAVGAATLLTQLGWAVLRDRLLGGLAATGVIGVVVSFRPLVLAWTWLRDAISPATASIVVAVIAVTILAIPAIFMLRARAGHGVVRLPATRFLNGASAVLLLTTILVHAGPDMPGMIERALDREPQVAVNVPAEGAPDIYVILLDGYPRADVLARRFETDNATFVNDLAASGFKVGTHNHSNYVFTQLTLASMFQMRLVQDIDVLKPLLDVLGAHPGALHAAITEGQVFDALDAAGYEIVATSAGYGHVSLRGVADRFLDHGEMTDLERSILNRTWLVEILGALDATVYSAPQAQRLEHAFEDIAGLAAERRDHPLFAFVHVPAPHLPVIVDAAGRPLPLPLRVFDAQDAASFAMSDDEFAAAYAGEISYLNQHVLEAVHTLQSDSARPPVIVVMSDHGYTHDVHQVDVQARFGNLFAAFTPGTPDLFAEPPTPVNLFPVLLNRYVGTDFPLSTDLHFLSPSPFELLQLSEVTDPEGGAQ